MKGKIILHVPHSSTTIPLSDGYLINNEASKAFFEQVGYSLGIDWPYKGSIVPLEHYQKNKNVQTIMLEINRALYLKESQLMKSRRGI